MPEWLQTIFGNIAVIKAARIVFLLVVAVAARLIVHKVIDRTVDQSVRRPVKLRAAVALGNASGLPAERRSQRLRALGSLAKSVTTVVLIILTVVAVLSELGFNVTTIVAGTSVVAAALAFGTQNIIKDLLAGIFMLVEDQLGVGDFVDMQLASGTVEEIGLRVTHLRADDGTVWYVRNGEVLRLANFSKGGPHRPADAPMQRMAVELVQPEPDAAAGPDDPD
ncbi:MAG TPA: mechanosensitive ion channel domain-containing protein [Microlunatus sp.]|nr:mechanosensitive ion channel domain-containing protein [Microlunatus sp.]